METEEFNKKCSKFTQFLKDKGFIMNEADIKSVLASVELGYPVMAKGPTGTGKTDFFCLLAQFLGGSYHYQSLNGSVHIEDMTQERIISDKGVQDQDMILPTWLRASNKGVSVLHLDEINAAKPETLLSLHSVIDIKKELFLPYTKERLKVNKNAVVVASCNEGDEYAGVNAMNMAFINRWVTVHFKYLSANQMAEMLSHKTDTPLSTCKAVVQVWSKYMSSREPEQAVVSPRILLMWLNLAKFIGLKEAGKTTFAGLVSENHDQLVEFVEGDLFVNMPVKE